MTIDINKNSALIDSATSGYSGCGCGNRRYYTKAEIDEMLKGVLDPEQIKEILDQMFEEYIESGDLYELILNVIGDIYTKDEVNALLAGKLDVTAFTEFKNEMEECCEDVHNTIEDLFYLINELNEKIDEITGSTPTPPGPDTGETGITAIRIIVAGSITDSGRASAVFTPSTAATSLYYTSSDTDIALIDNHTGEITVIQDGIVTFCVEDLYTGLKGCKEVNAHKSVEPGPDTGETGITDIQIIIADTITDNGRASTIYSPTSAGTVNIVYSSSDESIATIDPDTGEIEALQNGFVTFCVLDTISGLQNCKTVTVTKTDASGFGMAIYNATSTTVPTRILSSRGYNSFDYMIYNGQRTDIQSGTTTFTFPATGLQTVYYHLIDPTTIARAAFAPSGSDPIMVPQLVGFRIPQTVTTLAGCVFMQTGLREMIIPKNVVSIGDQCFYQCKSLSAFTFEEPAKITEVGGSALLYGSIITDFIIPDSFTEAPSLKYCKRLSALTIGSGVKMVWDNSYYQCKALKNVTVLATTPPEISQLSSDTKIFETDSLEHIFVPAQSVNAYKTAPIWSNYAQYITAITQ